MDLRDITRFPIRMSTFASHTLGRRMSRPILLVRTCVTCRAITVVVPASLFVTVPDTELTVKVPGPVNVASLKSVSTVVTVPPVAVIKVLDAEVILFESFVTNQPFVASIYCKRREARLVVISELVAAP